MRMDHSRLANYLIVVVLLVGWMVIIGWGFNIEWLKRPFPLLAAMNPWTAFCFILLSIAFLFTNGHFYKPNLTRCGKLLAMAVIAVALGKLCLPIDSWPFNRFLFADKVALANAAGLPSNMAINTCINFTIAGCCTLLLNSASDNKLRLAHYLTLGILSFSLFSLVGYLFHAKEFVQLVIRLPMAVHTSGSFILFSLAILFSHPHRGLSKIVTSNLYGGYIARFLLPVAIITPVMLGGLYIWGYAEGLYSAPFGTTILVVLFTVIFNFFIWFCAAMLNRKDSLKLITEQKLHEAEKNAKEILSSFNAELNRQVIIKTAILEKTTAQLRQLAAHLQTVREEEREKIARELHDELGQLFSGLKIDLLWLRKKTEVKNTDIQERLNRSLELLDHTYQTVRRISTDLHPSLLHTLGLCGAIELYCQKFQNRTGLKVVTSKTLSDQEEQYISGEIAIGLYRILQECLTNVLKHAVAYSVNIWLYVNDGMLTMGVEDDGKGFDPENLAGNTTLGLVSIRERTLMLKGQYTIDSIIGRGTSVWVMVPINS